MALLIGVSTQLGNGGGTTSDSDTSASDGGTTPEESNDRTPIGTTATDDNSFTFTIASVKCGIASVGSEILGSAAQGQYCAVDLTVENVGDKPEYFFADAQKAFDAEGREFSPDTTAMIYGNESSDVWMTEINPGNKINGLVYFDIPADASIDYFEFHASSWSVGVELAAK